jgi:predicted MFS family arabinose efflux permease
VARGVAWDAGVNATGAAAPAAPDTRRAEWALLLGNFAIGCGVMAVPGAMNDIVRSLAIGVAAGGQLVTVAAVVMALAAPTLAFAVGRMDRRALLTLALAWYALGHALSALMPHYAALLPVRAACMLGAAVFSPQAAAAIGQLVAPERRGRAITFVFLGWSLASVIGMPMANAVGEALGWRWAFALVSLLSLAGAAAVWLAVPTGVRPPVAGWAAWRAVGAQPLLLAVVAVTALAGTAQFTLFSYMAPIFAGDLGASAHTITALFFWFGVFGLLGNVVVSRTIDRVGASTLVGWLLLLMFTSFALWPLAGGALAMALVLVPWALACFGANSAQQARLGGAAPALAPVLMALNTSAIYLGQAAGAAGGGLMVAANQAAGRAAFAGMPWVAAAWVALALVVSVSAARAMARRAAA